MAEQEVLWELSGSRAVLRHDPLALTLDLGEPAQGAGTLSYAGQRSDAALFAWATCAGSTPALADCYVRGNDLVADYHPSEGCPFKTQVYWRFRAGSGANEPATIELILSVHTHRLDTHPVYTVWSGLGRARWAPVYDPGEPTQPLGAMARAASGGFGLVQTAEPGDFTTAGGPELSTQDDRPRISWRLFDQFLEKGVIRRARLATAFVASEETEARGAELCRWLQSQSTPLTA